MPARKGLLAPQNTFLDTIATRFDGTHGFCDLTGYSRAQIMQKSCACNFLYGPRTDVQHKEAISRALEQKQELKLEVILYKSTRTPFWCLLDIVPIQDEKHEVVLFLCSHKDITKQKLHEEKEHEFVRLLNAQKQQKLADHQNNALAANQQQHLLAQPLDITNKQQHQQQNALNDATNALEGNQQQQLSGSGAGDGGDNLEHHQQQETKLDEANEAELTALANQNALISMDEFELDDSGDDNEFDDLDDGEDHDKHTANQYSRRRSRAVLYQLSGHYGCRRSVNMKSKLKLNNRMNIPEYKTTTIEKQRFILSHYGVGKSCWDWLILIVSFYVAIVVPYNATFKDKHQDLSGECRIDSIDIIVEVVFIIDVILNFRTTFVNRKGEVVTRPKIICKHYIRGWFVVDACAAIPFDLLCSLNLYSRSRLDLNLLKLIRLLRLARLLQKMDRYSQYSYIILTLLMLIFSLLAHWCACIWYVIAMEEIERNPPEWKIGWIHQLSDKLGYSVVNTTDMASSYVTALYFTTSSLTSVGFGNVSANTNAEKIFSIVIMLIGALMHAVVFGNVTALIRVMYARRSNYQTRLRDLKDFFRLHQLPKELQQRMSDYFQTTWSLNHGIETYEILKDFPEELRGDVSLHLHREVLSLPIFETAPQGFLKSLARHIESKFCCPTEYLIHRRDALNYLYLVCNGSMEVLQDNMVVAILGKGDLVGYDVNAVVTPDHTQYGGLNKVGSMLGPPMSHGLVKSSSDLKALTYCDLKCIHISGLLDVLKLYPEFSDTFHREIIHDLSFNLRENHDEQTDEMTDDEEANGLGSPPIDDGYGGGGGNGAGGTRGNGAGGGSIGGGNGARRSPPPNIGHLYRSITSGENQIGRYDHLEEDAAGEEADEDEEEEEDDEEEEEDDEEEEEEEDGDDDDDDEDEEDENDEPEEGDGEEEEPDEGGGGKTGSGRNNNSTPNRQQQQQPGGTRTKEGPVEGTNPTPNERLTNGLTNSVTNQRHKTSSGRSLNELHNQRDDSRTSLNNWQHHHGGKSISDEELSSSIKTEVEASGDLAPDQMNPVANLRRRMIRAQEDCQSAHSYDGLMERTRRRRQVNANTEVARKIIKNNSSDTVVELINSGGSSIMSPTTRSLQHPQAHNTNSHPTSSRLRSASRVPGSIGSRKPPLSFDLSRNTTAIVDRRRRSAGCIPRTLLMGAVAAAAAAANNNSLPARANHSSLLHINEEPTSSSNSASNNHSNNKRTAASSRKSTALNRPNASAARSSGCEVDLNNTNYSSQDLKNIDARISGISASVREMKQELRVEMSQFRATIQLLMQLVDKQVAAPGKGGVSTRETTNNNESSGKTLVRSSSSLHSIANCSTNQLSALERRRNSGAKSRRNSNSNNKHSNKQQATGSALCLKTPIIKSLSAVGLSTTFNATNTTTTTTTTSVDPSSAAGYFQQQQQQQTSSKVQEAKSGQDQSNSMITTTTTTTNSAQKASGLGEGGAEQVISSSSLSLSSSSSLQPIGTSVRLNKPTTTVTTITKVNTLLPENGSTFSSSKDSSNSGVQLAQVSASLNQANPTLPHPLTPFATTNNANNPLDSNLQRPISQCSSPVTSDFRQSSSGANLNNHSDNDSGRSSSSVNSSSNNFLTRSNGGGAICEQAQLPLSNSTLMTKQQLVVQTSSSSAISSRNQPITQLSSPAPQSPPNLIGGRPAKMFVTEAGANHLRRYTIDIGDENNNEPELKSSKIISNEESNGSSIV